MRNFATAFALTAFAAGASAAAAPADVLDANKAATGGSAWDSQKTLSIAYAYSGQGMTGKVTSLDDLKFGYWADNFAIGPATGAQGFDGMHAWAKDQSGSVTQQDGGDQRQLAVNEAYRRANLWWRPNRGGAVIVDDGQKSEAGGTYEVLTVTPKGGKNFDAWFDTKSHLLFRLVEVQGPQTITTTLTDYAAFDGAEIARKAYVNNGDAKYDQTLTIASAAFEAAQPQNSYGAPKVTLTDYSIAAGATQTTFPFELINNHIYADVSINGRGPYLFIFDSGGVNLVTPALAAQLGLKTEGQMEGNGAGAGHVDVGLTKIDSLKIGDASINSQVFASLPLDALSNVEGIDEKGMVGFETFRRFVTRIDYGAHTMTLITPSAFDAKDSGTAVPITFNGNTIEVNGLYDGKQGNFTIDTGSRACLTLAAPFVARNKLREGAGKGVEAVTGWGVGGASRSFATRAKEFEFGSQDVKGTVAEMSTDTGGDFAAAATAGNIGACILKRYIVTLDYEHNVMYLKPVAGAIDDLDTFDRAGLWINGSDSGFKIVDITKNAPAEEAGLKAGDEIVAVDGKPASSLKLFEVRRMLRDEAPGTIVNFAIKRGNETKGVAVTLRDLI